MTCPQDILSAGVASRGLQGYELSKGTIRFTADHPLPEDVLRDIVRLRAGEIRGQATD